MAFTGREGTRRWLFVLAALAGSLYLALSANNLGDYPGDGGPAISALLHGDLHAFSTSTPLMGVFSLLLRLPFAGLAYLGSPTPLSIYRWGAFPCVASMALLGVWLAEIARSRGTRLPGQVAILALAVFNPFVQSALALGHPEELLTASLAIAAVISASQQRSTLTAVLLGLALASKQWAVLVVPLVLVVLNAHRLRALAGSVAIAAGVTLVQIVGSPGTYFHTQFALVHSRALQPWDSWLYPIAPHVTLHLGGGVVHRGPQLSATLVGLLHPLIIAVAVAIAVFVARRARPQLSVDHLFAAVALIFLLRCTLDVETVPYYHLPLFAGLLAWDAMRGERIPFRALAGAAVAYGLFDRMTPSAIGSDPAAWLYCAVTLLAAFVLVLIMRRRSEGMSVLRGAGADQGVAGGRPARGSLPARAGGAAGALPRTAAYETT